ncbi:MAG: hypothetical protein AB7S38_02690 [Vulcanimicrobiota bacterium]
MLFVLAVGVLMTLAAPCPPDAVPDGVELLLETSFRRAVERARGELLVFVSEGAVLCEGWQEGVRHAHRLGWAGVGPAVGASHHTSMAAAFMRLCYGAWAAPAAPQPHPRLPLGLSSYKLGALRALPAEALEDEKRAQRCLSEQGVNLFTDTRVEVTVASPLSLSEFWRRLQAAGRAGHAAPWRPTPPPLRQWPWLGLGWVALGLGAIQRVFFRASNER